MRTLNLGILAHVDAGKTTLSERLLFTAGAIDHVGSVDAGTTQTDSLELERERGITIRSAVASFLVGDLAVNLVDTPGHPDFIAEVERVLGVLDGAVLVVSAVEGVQPQTPLLFRALQRLHVPTLIFVNKIDRAGADPDRRRRGDATAPAHRVSCRWGTARDAGPPRRDVRAVHRGRRDPPDRRSIEALAEHDEAILDAYVARRGHAHARAPARAARRSRPGPVSSTRSSSVRRRGASGSTTLLAGIDELLGGVDRRPGAPTSRAASSRSSGRRPASASRTCACSRARCGRAQRVRVGRRGGGQADVDPRLRPDRRARAGTC